jgi:hypothetical protein
MNVKRRHRHRSRGVGAESDPQYFLVGGRIGHFLAHQPFTVELHQSNIQLRFRNFLHISESILKVIETDCSVLCQKWFETALKNAKRCNLCK